MNSYRSFAVKFVMKTDDDMFVVVPNLVHVLLGGTIPLYDATLSLLNNRTRRTLDPTNRMETTENLLMGYLMSGYYPNRDITSKYYAPNYMYDKNKYPDFLTGTGYVMSIDVATKLYGVVLKTPLFVLEDVYLTGKHENEFLNHICWMNL